MKIAPQQIDRFLNAPPADVSFVLIYGPDSGLVAERARLVARATSPDLDDPFRVTRLTGPQCAEDSSRLRDEMASLPFGGGSRLVWVKGAVDALHAALKDLVADPPQNPSRLILEAGDLEKRSKLRALFEDDKKNLAALPCYVEEGAARQATITKYLEGEGLRAARDVLAQLCDILPEDRGSLMRELEKLALYAHGQKEITAEDLSAVLVDTSSGALDDLALATGAGDVVKTARLLDQLFAEQTSPVALLRTLQRHFLRLQLARAHCDSGLSAREAVGKLQPKLFWKIEAPFTQQLQRWSSPKIAAALQRLYEAEANVKKTHTPDEALCAQLITQLAML